MKPGVTVGEPAAPAWLVTAGQECRELWAGGRGPGLVLAFSVLLSALTYLVGTNHALNYLEQRESVSLLLQVAVGVGTLVTMIVAADAISGERERGTLEPVLLSPVPRRQLLAGKMLGALTLWWAALLVTAPYVVVLGRGVGVSGRALLTGGVVGTVLAAGVAGIGLVLSGLARSNRTSVAGSLLLLLALFAPTQLPTGARQGTVGDLLVRLDPVDSAEHYLGAVLVSDHGWSRDLSYLLSPVLTVLLAGAALALAADRLVALDAGREVW
jgi:ABC-2 type transport system permease protein